MKSFLMFLVSGSKTSKGADIGLLLGRLGFGLVLAFGHGMGKLPPSEQFIGFVGSTGLPMATVMAWAAALAEFAGALMIALGLFTRPAALAVLATMGVAVFMVHGGDPISSMEGASKEGALMYLFAALIFLFSGAGKLSIDELFRRAK